MGLSVLLVSYRGYGKSDGVFPDEAKMYADAEAAWNYLVVQKQADPTWRLIILMPVVWWSSPPLPLSLTWQD